MTDGYSPPAWQADATIKPNVDNPYPLLTQRDNYGDFHLRLEVRFLKTTTIPQPGNLPVNGILFRISSRVFRYPFRWEDCQGKGCLLLLRRQKDDALIGPICPLSPKDISAAYQSAPSFKVSLKKKEKRIAIELVVRRQEIHLIVENQKFVSLNPNQAAPLQGRLGLLVTGKALEFRALEIKELSRPMEESGESASASQLPPGLPPEPQLRSFSER